MAAYDELLEFLNDGEQVEAIVFGPWGWGNAPASDEAWERGYGEPDDVPVPFDMRGKVLSLEDAAPFMQQWDFNGGFGAPACYATYIWTDRRVIWVTQYDGSTGLDSA